MDKTSVKNSEDGSPLRKKIEITNPKQKRLLKTAGIAAAVLGVAGGAYALHEIGINEADSDSDPLNPANQEPAVIYTDAPLAAGVSNDMSFSEAFGAAREELGPGGVFVWNGAVYNTYTADEWEAMSNDEQNEFVSSVEIAEPDAESEPISNPEADPAPLTNIDETAGPASETEDAEEPGSATSPEAAPEPAEAPGTSPDQEQVPVSGPEPVNIPADVDGDGVNDAVITDLDGDGIADFVSLDADNNGTPEVFIVDSDDVVGLDVEVIDQFETGDPEQFILNPLDGQVVIEMDQLELESSYDEPQKPEITNNGEPLPDIDNNYDVSDFDTHS
ncbi:MAG: hypothetical protein AB9834_19455 [Lentimicrobium sp.]